MPLISIKNKYPDLLKNKLIDKSILKSNYKKIINKYGYNDISKIIVLEELFNYIQTNFMTMNNISKYLINNITNKKYTKEEKSILRTFIFKNKNYILIPYLFDKTINLVNFNNIYISEENSISGTYSSVYLSIFKQNKDILVPLDYVLKLTLYEIQNIKSLYDEFIANIIHYILYKTSNKSKSIVKIIEFGVIKKPYKGVYSILEKCDYDLHYYLKFKDISYLKDINKLIIFFINILLGVKYLHNIGYVHLDLKAHNYLIKIENKKLIIKLTDFGFLKRIGDIDVYPGTQYYGDPRICKVDNLKKIKADKMMDIFSLGILFIDIILVLINTTYFYRCPLLINNLYDKLDMREKYYTNIYENNNFNSDIPKIKKFYSKINNSMNKNMEKLFNINLKMISNIDNRYTNIDDIIKDLVNISK